MDTAKTRIVQLDAEILDKNQQISVLWSRIKILEEKVNNENIHKYFPNKNQIPSKTNINQTEHHPSGHNTSMMRGLQPNCSHLSTPCSRPPSCTHIQPQQCFPLCHCQPHHSIPQCLRTQSSDSDFIRKLSLLESEIMELKTSLNELKPLLLKIPSTSSSDMTCPDLRNNQTHEIPNRRTKSNEATHDFSLNSSQNESIASIEEFIPEMPEEDTTIHLNSQSLTNQLL